jgi:hypothetical protein
VLGNFLYERKDQPRSSITTVQKGNVESPTDLSTIFSHVVLFQRVTIY